MTQDVLRRLRRSPTAFDPVRGTLPDRARASVEEEVVQRDRPVNVLGSTLGRRMITVPAVIGLFTVAWLGAPALLPAAIVVDVVRWSVTRTPWMAVRLVVFLMLYSAAEVLGLIALGTVWVGSLGGRLFDLAPSTFAIQQAWAVAVFGAIRSIFGLRVDARGLDAVETPPYLLVARHASIVDNLLPAICISRPHRIPVRYIMKRELLMDPAIDVAGNRMPNVFISRTATESRADIRAIRDLAATLPPGEAVLIYPEGTRFSTDKLERSLAILRRRNPVLGEQAASLTSVLPPRPAGTLALLETTDADVVVLAHRGLDGFARVADIWRGAMVRTRVEVEFWRIPRSEIPDGVEERTRWLFALWREIDGWVTAGS